MCRLVAVSLFSVMLAAPAICAPAPEVSWGKAGISLDQYRQDSVECGLQGYNTDISNTDDAQEFVRASRQLDAATVGAMSPSTTPAGGTGPATTDSVDQAVRYAQTQQHIVDSVRPDERFRSIKKKLISNTEECLVKRGYSKFGLTEEQRQRLRKLKFGSEERRTYLYSLASNSTILEAQKLSPRP
jgi:hypothetical protein